MTYRCSQESPSAPMSEQTTCDADRSFQLQNGGEIPDRERGPAKGVSATATRRELTFSTSVAVCTYDGPSTSRVEKKAAAKSSPL